MGDNNHSQLIKPLTKCKLCGQEFTKAAIGVPIIGEPVTAEAERFVNALALHFSRKHHKETNAIMMASKQLYGYLTLAHYETQDAGLLQLAELIRYDLHRSTCKIVISDDHVRKGVEHLKLAIDDQRRVIELICDLRDLLTDSGAYAPQRTAPVSAIT